MATNGIIKCDGCGYQKPADEFAGRECQYESGVHYCWWCLDE